MRIINVINDFLKIFFKIRSSKVKNYYKRTVSFDNQKNQITEKKYLSKIILNKKIKKILDYGCNNCSLKLYLSKKIIYWGVDTNKDINKHVRLYSKNFKIIKKNIPFKDKYFDCVILSHVISHLDNPRLNIQKISKKLKKNGFLIIVTPNKLYKFFIFFLNLFNNYESDLTIYKHFSNKEIEKKILNKSWKVIDSFSYSIRNNKITYGILNSRCIIIAKKTIKN